MSEGEPCFICIYIIGPSFIWLSQVEVIKLQKHLALLREEYVKLQNKYTELERKHNVLSSIANKNNQNPHLFSSENYISRLLKTISELFDKELYRCAK